MPRNLFSIVVPCALALLIASSGCGGGGNSHKGTDGNSTDGGNPGTVDGTGVVRDIYGQPATGARVTFFDAGGSVLNTVTIGTDGQAGTPPSGATRFSVDVQSVTSSGSAVYYNTFLYNGLHYDATIAGCNPSLSNGAFVSSIVFTNRATGLPPAAPDGCVGAS